MPEPLKRLARILKLGVVAGAAVGVVRVIRGQRTPAVTGTASWPPLVPEDPPPARSGPVRFTDTGRTGDEADTDGSHPDDRSTGRPTAPDTDTGSDADGDAARTWVAPVDGACPADHPIKGNADSGIYHVPGGMSYDRTVPERCYATEADAEADGFRKAKR